MQDKQGFAYKGLYPLQKLSLKVQILIGIQFYSFILLEIICFRCMYTNLFHSLKIAFHIYFFISHKTICGMYDWINSHTLHVFLHWLYRKELEPWEFINQLLILWLGKSFSNT
jgi:hypothetical protein